jgi:diguanylate cyclase
MESPYSNGRNKLFLTILGSLGFLTFMALWELRWYRLTQSLRLRQDTTNEWVERALHDPLTSLPNRSLLNDRIEQALIRAQRNDTIIAVLFIDLDNFKEVNDRYGHLVGDQILVAVGDRLKQHLRASDTAGRIGGDEFVVLLEVKHASDPVMMVAERLRRALHVPLLLEPAPITLSASIGISVSETGDERVEDLLNRADDALLKAKQAGKDQVKMAPVASVSETAESQASN